MTCYLYDPARRLGILREAASPEGTTAHIGGYGPRFETAVLMLREGLLAYDNGGWRLRVTAAGRELLEEARPS